MEEQTESARKSRGQAKRPPRLLRLAPKEIGDQGDAGVLV